MIRDRDYELSPGGIYEPRCRVLRPKKLNIGLRTGGYAAAPASFAAFSAGINFRSTSGYVIDGAGYAYCLASDAYPTTRNGWTFGWVSNLTGALDESNTNDVRLAGFGYRSNNGTIATFRFDLPAAGTYSISLASGSIADGTQAVYLEVKDTSTSLGVIGSTSLVTGGNQLFGDATGTIYSNVSWPGSNTSISKVFATTQLNLLLGDPAATQGTNVCLNSLIVVRTA